MISIEGQKLVTKIQKDIIKSGLEAPKLVEDLTKLRGYSIEAKEPTMTKVIRLTYEHLQNFDGFHIPIPVDEAIEETTEEGVEVSDNTVSEENLVTGAESLEYLLSLILESDNKLNRQEIIEYRDALMKYAKEND